MNRTLQELPKQFIRIVSVLTKKERFFYDKKHIMFSEASIFINKTISRLSK